MRSISVVLAFVVSLLLLACGPGTSGTGGAGGAGGAAGTGGAGGRCSFTGMGVIAGATWNPSIGVGHAFGVTFTHPAPGETLATLECPLPAGTFGAVVSPTITPGGPGTWVNTSTWTTGPGAFTVYTWDATGPADYVFSLQVVELP